MHLIDKEKTISPQVTSKLLRVLIVEDSHSDAGLLIRALKKGGFDLQCETVDTSEQMQQALSALEWDIILSDYNLPLFSGLKALQVMHSLDLDLPFIIISGAIGEETAVEAMRAGAHDYIMKDNLIRLIPAIERELKEAGARRLLREGEETRSRLEKELQQAKHYAELANQRKSRVLAFVAHEFKNPLKAIQTFTEILEKGYEKGRIAEDQLEMVQGISTASQHIRELMNDILDIAPIEAGKISINRQVIHLQTLLDEVRIIVEESAKQKKIQIKWEKQSALDLINIDPKRLRQILINLLSNAIKYTNPSDTIFLKIFRSEDNAWLQLNVEDHGPGIPEEELENLFLDYYRVQNIFSQQNEGLGLGLALVRKLVELHQGTISVDSQVGEGTTFSVCFPMNVIVETEIQKECS